MTWTEAALIEADFMGLSEMDRRELEAQVALATPRDQPVVVDIQAMDQVLGSRS